MAPDVKSDDKSSTNLWVSEWLIKQNPNTINNNNNGNETKQKQTEYKNKRSRDNKQIWISEDVIIFQTQMRLNKMISMRMISF